MSDFRKFMDILDGALPSGSLTPALVESLEREYPFMTLPASMLLKSGRISDVEAAALKARIALNASDTDSLIRLIDPDGSWLSGFYPPEPQAETPTTEKAIDTFLDNYGTIDPHEQELLERLIFNPVPDYSQVLAGDVARSGIPEPVSEQDAMLDAFLATRQTMADEAARRDDDTLEVAAKPHIVKPSPDSSLNESLAKMYIKKHRYDKAYEIIYQLSLNFPEKSVYFADQLRFLRKLMLNREHGKR